MKFELLPSLQETTVFKVCATLWCRSIDLRRIIGCRNAEHPNETENGAAWRNIENEIKAKVPELGLTRSLETEVSRFLKPIGVELLKWCEFHCLGGYLDVHMPNEFFWTSHGKLDLKKTAEVLVRDERLARVKRYKLAYIYCLRDDIVELSQCGRSIPCNREEDEQAVQHELVSFWNSCVTGDYVPPEMVEHRHYVQAFIYAAHCGNIAAVKYFCEKLTTVEQKQSVMDAVRRVLFNYHSSNRIYRAFPKEFYPRVLRFLLSLLDTEEQIDVFKIYSSEILLCFVDWPCQSFIIEILELISDSVCSYACTSLLIKIADKDFEGHDYYDYSELFTKVWLQLSEYCKSHVVIDCRFRLLIITLLIIRDANNIRLLLKHVEPVKKKQILYSHKIIRYLVTGNDCDLFELLIRECIPSKNDMLLFKEELTELNLLGASEQFLSLLDRLIREHDKRKCEDDENDGNSSKKLGAQEEAVDNA